MLCSGTWVATLVLLAFLPPARCLPEDLGLPLTGGRPQRPPVSIRESNRAASERVGARGGGGWQRASGYGRRLALLPAWGGCSTTDTERPKPPGSSMSRCLCPRKTPAIQSRQWNNASKQTTQPDGGPRPKCDAPHLHSPSPLSPKLPLLLSRMLTNGRCGRPLVSGKPRSSGRQRAGGKNASRTQVADSDPEPLSAGRRGWAGRRAPSAGGGALWAPHHAAGDRRHDHPRRPSTQRSTQKTTAADQAAIYATPPTRPTGRTKEIAVSPACENTSASCS